MPTRLRSCKLAGAAMLALVAIAGTYVLAADRITTGDPAVQKVDNNTLLPIGVALAVCASAITATWVLASDRANVLKNIESLHAANARNDTAIKALERRFDRVENSLRRLEIQAGTWPGEDPP